MNLLSPESGITALLLGNEAIVRGALEAGVGFVSCYPGTPSSEVPDTFFRLSRDGDFHFEYSINEKVALEVAGGASLGGIPTLATMKHVGVNVAADPLMSLAYIGTPGGLVILSADDPGCHSSQNEQDNRYYARLAGLPCFEPATAQECKDMTREAFQLSAKWQQPVMLRTTTRINHMRAPVTFDTLPASRTKGSFNKNPQRYVLIPAVGRARHKVLISTLEDIREEVNHSPWNSVQGEGKLGVIASGVSRSYLRDALKLYPDIQVKTMEIGLSYPFPEDLTADFLQDLDRVLILEELEPVLENEIRQVCQKRGLNTQVLGKDQDLHLYDEYTTPGVSRALHRLLDLEPPREELCSGAENSLPNRPPNLCAGCPHRSVYVQIRKHFGDEAVYSTDIGCYTLGILPPLKTADFLFCMGSSVSGGCGMSRAVENPVVAFIGDSTFFHSGITGLINAVYNNHDLLLVILDNRTTAMTGHQPHPGVDQSVFGHRPGRIEIEPLVRAAGVEQVTKIKALNQKALDQSIAQFKATSGVRVLIAEEPCPLYARRVLGQKRNKKAYVATTDESSLECLNTLACPAFYLEEGEFKIDPVHCSGCMVCVQLSESIKTGSRS